MKDAQFRKFSRIYLLLAWLIALPVLTACGGGGDGDSSATTDCSSGVSNIAPNTPVSNIPISENRSHCYSFDSVPGGRYRITLTPLSGDADVAAFDDPVMNSDSILTYSNDLGTTVDQIVINPEVSRVYIEVFGFLTSTYNLVVVPIQPTALVPAHHEVALNQRIFLDGSKSTSTSTGAITHYWKMLSKPVSSTIVFPDQSGEVVDFVPDVFGDYVFELYVQDNYLPSEPVTTTVSVNFYQTALPSEPIAAEYSENIEKLILVSTTPNSLYRFDPSDRSLASVDLHHTPKALAISPDGRYAAVGHDQWISYVDLISMALVKTVAVSVYINDLVLDGNGNIHMVGHYPPFTGSYPYRSINITTEIEGTGVNVLGLMSASATILLDSDARVLHSTDRIRSDISSGVAVGLYRGNDYSLSFPCSKAWLTEDLTRLLWRCGEIMKFYPTRSQDYILNGKIEHVGSRYQAAGLYHSIESGEVVGIIEDIYYTDPDLTYDSDIRIYDDESLTETGIQPMPLVANASASYPVHGKFIFTSGDGTQYIALAEVDDDAGLSTNQFVFTTQKSGDPLWLNRTPVANAGKDRATNPATTIDLDGRRSSDADANPLSYSWRLIAAPAGSGAVLTNPSSGTPRITPELVGEYLIGLTVNDGFLTSHEDIIKLTVATATDQFLLQPGFDIFDAEYSDALGMIVGISSQEQALFTIDVANFEQKTVALPEIGQAVSVSPDGQSAVVGHDGWVSHVDLMTGNLITTFPTSINVFDIVLDDNGFAHGFKNYGNFLPNAIRTIDLATGTETLSSTSLSQPNDNTRARLHHNGLWIYGADNGRNPDDIEKYDISATPVNIEYDSPYHGDFHMCGDLWFTETSPVIVTRCGNIFSTDAVRALDMLHLGAIPLGSGNQIASLTHSSEVGRIALLSEDTGRSLIDFDPLHDTDVYFYSDSAPYTLIESQPLPEFDVGGTSYPSHGKLIFYNTDGSRYFAITRADDSAPAIDEYGIYFAGN